jgi:UDP-N-acetylmuramoyl-L-alanine---L-glutamate ligase
MLLRDLQGKTVCILGFGKEGKAALEAIEREAPTAEVTIADENADVKVENAKHWLQTGTGWLKNLEKFDVVIASPGIPPLAELEAIGEKLSNATQIFLDEAKARGAIVIGITGSKGKSTTTSLITAALTVGGKDVVLAGNIGLPALAELPKVKQGTVVVLEMSSYQLRLITTSPHIAVITSFFPEHLDYHGSLEAYFDAKTNIAKFQKEKDLVIYSDQSTAVKDMASRSHGKKILVTPDSCPLPLEQTKLLGAHNRENLALAFTAATFAGVDRDACMKAFIEFSPLPHRLQSLGMHHGIHWIDDAISTTPESTIAALDALGDNVITVILGGQDRGLDFGKLGRRIAASKVRTVILFPETGERIRDAIAIAHADVCFQPVTNMPDAIQAALKHTEQGKICLLSTASPSYNMFKNFEEKGDKFREAILALE